MVIKFQDRQDPKKDTKNYAQGNEKTEGFRLNIRENDTVTRNLFRILAVLCVLLVAAVIWQQYEDAHTYHKGELALQEEGSHKQRLQYLTDPMEEAQEEPEAEPAEEAAVETETEKEENSAAAVSETEADAVAEETQAETEKETLLEITLQEE